MYEAKNYDHLIGTAGFSDQLLKNHFTLYQGYVTNTNKLSNELVELINAGKLGTPQYAELKRRFGWEFNGMRLHELYFGNMRPVRSQTPEASAVPLSAGRTSNGVNQKIIEKYGSYDVWEKDFKATGTMRGIGWTVLYHDPESKDIFNVWVNEHDVGHLAGCTPLLVLDVFEHAYTLDYGIKKADYIEAFFKAIDWGIVVQRLK